MTIDSRIDGLIASIAELEFLLNETSENDEDVWLNVSEKLDNAKKELDLLLIIE